MDGYVGIHIYFKNKSNFYYPWELQLWDENDLEGNIAIHIKYMRKFVGYVEVNFYLFKTM